MSDNLERVIAPIIFDTYGRGSMPRALVVELARKIRKWPDAPQPRYGATSRLDMVRLTCWDWYSGGTTAANVAERIESALPFDASPDPEAAA